MKRNITHVLICLLAILSLASCKKEKNEKTTTEKILGKWNLSSREEIETINGQSEKDVYVGVAGEYVDFRSNNKVYVKEQGEAEENADYRVDNDKQITFTYDGTDHTVFTIKELNSNKLVLYSRQVISSSSSLKTEGIKTSETLPRNLREATITLTR